MRNVISRCFVLLTLAAPLAAAEETTFDAALEQAYEKLLREDPSVRRKVERGDATKEQVIEWLRQGGGRRRAAKPSGEKQYYGKAFEVKDPSSLLTDREAVVYSGPQSGERLPPFVARGMRGAIKDQAYDPVAVADGGPLVLIFQGDSVVGLKGLLLSGPVLRRIAEASPNGLLISTTFLADDPSPRSIFEYDFVDEISDVVQMSVSTDGRDGPGVYGLNRNVAMTILVARDGVVLHNFAFTQPMLYPDPHVMGAIAEAIGVDRPMLASWFRDDGDQVVAADVDRDQNASRSAFKKRLGEFVDGGRLSVEEATELYQAAFSKALAEK